MPPMMMNTSINAGQPLTAAFKRSRFVITMSFGAGACPGLSVAHTMTTRMKPPMVRIPDNTPARKSLLTDCSVNIPYRINKTLGGISEPRVPPIATVDVASCLLYPYRSISGTQIRPIDDAQAKPDPVLPEKPPQPNHDATASPPGIFASQTRTAS